MRRFLYCYPAKVLFSNLIHSPLKRPTRSLIFQIHSNLVNYSQISNLVSKKIQRNLSNTLTKNKNTSTMSELLIQAKRLAARKAVDDHVKDGQVIGIGSGSTIVFAVERIAERVTEEKLSLICVPTSYQAKNLIISNKLNLSDLDANYNIDLTIDGCDECDDDLNLIKGGGGCLLQEKIVASASKKFIIIADYTKDSIYLGEKWTGGIPIEVSQIGWKVVESKLNKLIEFLEPGKGSANLRLAVKKMGPVVTDNGNFIIDLKIGNVFKKRIESPQNVEKLLKSIPGIFEVGLFNNMASEIYFGQIDGTVKNKKIECESNSSRKNSNSKCEA